jgi:glycosyltransferase involved in cell wall biosynthesis
VNGPPERGALQPADALGYTASMVARDENRLAQKLHGKTRLLWPRPNAFSRTYGAARTIWHGLPLPMWLRVRCYPLLNFVAYQIIVRRAGRSHQLRPVHDIEPGNVVVSGYLTDVNGIGRAGRLTYDAISAWKAPMVLHDLRADPSGLGVIDGGASGGLWICHCNPPEVLAFMAAGNPRIWAERYRIGYWAYELETLPADWRPAIRVFHEIWAPSQFVADAIIKARGPVGPIVRVVPHPLPNLAGVNIDRERFRLTEAFTFLTMFDTRSTAARKNPLGAIKAFQLAFTPHSRGVSLLVKVVEAGGDKAGSLQLDKQIAGWPNIVVMTDHLSDDETLGLIASVDCVVTLFRSEGFGLTVAEAMILGTPVIATGWSGPTEFSKGAAIHVPYRLVPVVDASGRYAKSGQLWAEPDLDKAAEAMRAVFGDKAARSLLVATARQLARERLGKPISSLPYERFLSRRSS